MTYYLKQKPRLVEPLIKKKICKIVQNNQPKQITIMSIIKKIIKNLKYFYSNYLDEHIYIIMTVLLISFFLYYRYHFKQKNKQQIDIIPNDISYDTIINMNNMTNYQKYIPDNQKNNIPFYQNNKYIIQ